MEDEQQGLKNSRLIINLKTRYALSIPVLKSATLRKATGFKGSQLIKVSEQMSGKERLERTRLHLKKRETLRSSITDQAAAP